MKVVYFATGTPAEVSADLKRLSFNRNGASLRVVLGASLAGQLGEFASLRPEQTLFYQAHSAPVLWLRLMKFLGLSPNAEVICLSSRQRFRFLKFMALTLRGKVTFSANNGTLVSFSLGELLRIWGGLLWAWIQQIPIPQGPVCIIGSASPSRLSAIVASARQRFPEARIHGVLPSASGVSPTELFDSFVLLRCHALLAYFRLLPRCIGKRRFQRVILACTNEQASGLKWLAWWLPLWNLEIYNENIDAFHARNLRLLVRHWLWRKRNNRELHRQTLPVGVMGSASAFYLKKIIPRLRTRYPAAKLHGFLPSSLAGPAAGLFDSVTILRPGILGVFLQTWRLGKTRGDFQCWIIPCTNEPYLRMKLLACLLPLSRRQIYNEQADGFPARDVRTLYRHFLWRLRDRLSFQIVAGTAGRSMPLRLLHLGFFSLRLLSGAELLLRTRLRAYLSKQIGRAAVFPKAKQRVDLLYLGSEGAAHSFFKQSNFNGRTGRIRLVPISKGPGQLERINTAIGSSQADFICLMDSECRMLLPDWLDRLLETFDEGTAQVGPQVVSPDGGGLIRGLLIGKEGTAQWNSDNGVCCHSQPEWLEVDALPWICVLLRRSVFQQVGFFREYTDAAGQWVDWDFCRRLAAQGLHSVCNQNVTAAHPAANAVCEPERQLVNSENRR
ncbi:MAG: hypothetical protein O7A06_10635 [Acidobacteria bacterium]|nr:hypothetical protein [Acidobacteriota bacterium]MCZ6751166.1 hypothetical protein [Acidobacteriota bacterium]